MKPAGDCRGGRVFFVDQTLVDLAVLTDYLERQPVLFNSFGAIAAPKKWDLADG